MDATSTLVFFVNGKKVIEPQPDPEWTLLYYLRNKLRLCGTKLGCAEGGCGACTVMVSRSDEPKNQVRHFAVNACLAPVCSMHGLAVTTVEGIGSTRTKLHPVQERIAKAHGSQCGFCTPGFVMSMYSLLRQMPKPKMKDLEIAFQGNLCRCTGYRPIIDGYKTFTEEFRGEMNGTNGHDTWIANGFSSNGCGMGDKCCKLRNGVEKNEEVLFDPSVFIPYDPTQEPIFPPELKISNTYSRESLVFKSKNVTWYRPKNLQEILELKAKYPEAKIVVGNTEVGVEMKFKNCLYPVLIYPTLIKEMIQITTTQDGVRVGASVTLDDLGNYLQTIINTEKPYKTRIFKAITDMLHFFAGKQVRNVAAIGGNIMTGSPISDLNPILLASKVKLELISEKNGTRYVLLDENFFTGYRRNVVKNDEILVSITIPYTTMHQYFWAHKQARRRDDDIAIVNHAMNVTFETDRQVIETIYLAYGGLAPITASPKNTQKKLIGLPWNQETLELAFQCLLEDLPLQPSAPGGMIKYRRTLMLSLFFKGFLCVSQQLKEPLYKLDERTISATENFHSKLPKSSQYFEMRPTKEVTHMLGRPMVHQSAYKQATGEAVYCDDLPLFENEVYMAFVYSQKSHAKILNIDPSEALKMEGVHAYVSKNDIPAMTKIGSVIHDEEIFFNEIVTSQMQIIAAVVADNQVIAQRAAKKVKVSYEDLQPVVVTIEDAIKYDSYLLKEPKKLENGDVDAAFKDSPNIIEGECRMGGQEHFYLETQCVICVPKKEDYEMEIYSSTQHPSEISDLVAKVLNIPQNRIITKVKRLGGGFGGKESKAALVAVPAAVAAFKLNRPVRIMLDRDEDIALTGGRHPFLFKYRVGFDCEGKILCLEVKIYQNCGYSYDLSLGVLERAIFHIDNAFRIPVIRVFGYACKTNLPSNTAFRGFGGPQGMFAIETIVRQIADYLQKDVLDVTERNLYKEGDLTHYNQKLEHCTLKRCWDECLIKSDYHERKKATEKFNSNNRYKKRGLSVVPTKFGIAFTVPHLNQGGALLLVYKDGSVLLSHGGTEMGQGLHTKMLQVASKALDIPVSKIHISETATDKVPNTSPTAASAGSDINGMAVLEACEKINNRLKPFKEKNPKGTWEDWVNQAYYDRVSLAATGFYKTPFIGFNWETLSGHPFSYFTFGVAATEVEIDCLTGDHQVLRTDIVMDLGESLNPAIDIGQIEGAFVQGYGLFILEELMYAPNGTLFTRGPGAYKLPSLTDIPIEFNVSLLKGAPNPRAVYSSKAVGEPPLFLASSVLFALREAIKDARKDAGVNPSFILNAPATSANIRINCEDHLTAKVPLPEPESFVPWNVTV